MMNNDHSHEARVSCEETFTEDMGPATWANEPAKKPFYADAKAEFGDPRSEPQPEPSYKEAHGRCEDAPCCGCCGGYEDDGYGSPADDAWHDANEYPDW